MNLYDRIKPGKRRRGWSGAVFLAAACVVLVICIGTIGWAARYHQRYRRFSTDFAASVENAGKIGAALTRNGETSSLDPDASSRLCRLICAAGAGKVQPSCPQGSRSPSATTAARCWTCGKWKYPKRPPKPPPAFLCVIPLPMERFTNMTRTRSK